jgi:cobalamin synthase
MAEAPRPRDFLFAVRLLTALPAGSGGALGPATLFFPVVGLLIGLPAAAIDSIPALPPPLRAVAAVLVLAAITRWSGWRGVALVGGALPHAGSRSAALSAMQRQSPGGLGWAVASLLVAAKLAALWRPGPLQPWALLFAPLFGRWAMVIVAFSARQAREGPPGPRFDAGITFHEFGWASVIAVGAALVLLEAVGLIAALGAAAVSIVLRLVWHRWLGGLEPATFRASGEVVEVAALLLFALFKVR